MTYRRTLSFVVLLLVGVGIARAESAETKTTSTRVKAYLDSIKAIDTHSHLRGFDEYLAELSAKGRGFTLRELWANNYLEWIAPSPAWPAGEPFDAWWGRAQPILADMRATSFYRSLLPAFRHLYGVDFDTLTVDQARSLNDRLVANYRSEKWICEVVMRRANIERMLIDPYWARFRFPCDYPFAVVVINVTTLIRGTHPGQYRSEPTDEKYYDPYLFAKQRGIKVQTLDDYMQLVETIIAEGKKKGGVCLKNSLAYDRTLQYDDVPRQRAEKAFGKPPEQLSAQEQKDFEDFIFRHVVRLAAKFDLPLQIHTGHARIQGSNPMLLVDLIDANPKTKFVLFHGGYPWVGETGVIAMKYPNVWIDSCWLPTLNYTMARRAYQEWLDSVPSDRILWGSDISHAEGVYGSSQFTRQCLAEALAEKIDRGELREEHALRIGRQILRENALRLFPSLVTGGSTGRVGTAGGETLEPSRR